MSAALRAREVADRVVSSVLGEVMREFDDRRDNPVFWYAFHDEMVRTLPWGRRAWHKLMRRRYRAFIKAKAWAAKACGVNP